MKNSQTNPRELSVLSHLSPPMQDMRDSAALTHTVKIVRMVVNFHPLLIVTNLIFGLTFLQDWIKEEVSNQWKALNLYCQSTMRALLDPIIEKMKNLSKVLQMHLDNEAAKDQPKAKLIGKLALFFATFLLLDTDFSSKYDKRGVKTQLLLFIGLDLLIFSKIWSQFGILRERGGYAANSTSNFTFFILAIVFAKFYDNSLRSLSVVLFMALFFLCLLVILRPQTDFGLFSFIIGVIGSIAYNRFEFTSPTWIIASICFVLFSFKSWLDKYWLNLEQNQSLYPTNTMVGSNNVILILSSGIRIASAIFAYSVIKSPLSDYKVWLVRVICSVICNFRRRHKLYPKDIPSPSTNTKGINNLILTIVNIAQGIFMFTLHISPVTNYKDWLLTAIIFVILCFWLRSFFLKDLSPPSTKIKGISGVISSSLFVVKYVTVVLVGLEPHFYGRDWLVAITCWVLWWVRLHMSLPKYLLLTAEFKATQWWTVVIYYTISDVISWTIQQSTTRH